MKSDVLSTETQREVAAYTVDLCDAGQDCRDRPSAARDLLAD